jgi:hypothetical protein
MRCGKATLVTPETVLYVLTHAWQIEDFHGDFQAVMITWLVIPLFERPQKVERRVKRATPRGISP